jgi:hypothetical protein
LFAASAYIKSQAHAGWAVFEQQLYRVPKSGDRGIGVFGRVSSSPTDSSLIDLYADAGIEFIGLSESPRCRPGQKPLDTPVTVTRSIAQAQRAAKTNRPVNAPRWCGVNNYLAYRYCFAA